MQALSYKFFVKIVNELNLWKDKWMQKSVRHLVICIYISYTRLLGKSFIHERDLKFQFQFLLKSLKKGNKKSFRFTKWIKLIYLLENLKNSKLQFYMFDMAKIQQSLRIELVQN